MTSHPPLGLMDVYSATLPTLKYSPGVHVNYAETVLPMKDGLPKFKDFPAEFGGSGERIKPMRKRGSIFRVKMRDARNEAMSSGLVSTADINLPSPRSVERPICQKSAGKDAISSHVLSSIEGRVCLR